MFSLCAGWLFCCFAHQATEADPASSYPELTLDHSGSIAAVFITSSSTHQPTFNMMYSADLYLKKVHLQFQPALYQQWTGCGAGQADTLMLAPEG